MNVGVVGNTRYEDLPKVLRELQQLAPARDISLFTEEDLVPMWETAVPPVAGRAHPQHQQHDGAVGHDVRNQGDRALHTGQRRSIEGYLGAAR